MAQKPLRPCKHPGCPEVTREGWCPAHKPRHTRRESAAYHGWYGLPVWKDELRPAQLLREPFCRECARQFFRCPLSVSQCTPRRLADAIRFIPLCRCPQGFRWQRWQSTAAQMQGCLRQKFLRRRTAVFWRSSKRIQSA